MSLTPTERKLRASIAGATGWANTVNRSERGRHAGRGNWEKFYRQTDPTLPDKVRTQIADSAYRAHMQRMAFRSLKARRERAERDQQGQRHTPGGAA
jgi:hypothetical protein